MDILTDLPYFTLVMVMQLREITEHNARMWLSRSAKIGKIIRLKKNLYVTRDYYLAHKNEPNYIPMVASIIQPQSYLSDVWVLQKWGIVTEGIFNITSVTTRHASHVVNFMGSFDYFQMNEKYFDGYSEHNVGGVVVREASPAKALYDYFYLRKASPRLTEKNYSVAEDMRLNIEHFDEKMRQEFGMYIAKWGGTKMKNIERNIRRNIWV